MNIVQAKDVSFSFEQNQEIIKNITFDANEDEFISIIGPSGCGKSTFLRIIAGLIKPTKGGVFYKNKLIEEPIKSISFVFQDFALMPWLTNIDNVKIGYSRINISESEKGKRATELLNKFGLNGFEYAYPNMLSGGMKQRVGIARALASKPDVLLMDEPFSALDELTANTLRFDVLKQLKDKTESVKLVIMVTHNVEEAVELSDKIIVLSEKPSKVLDIKKINMKQPRNKRSKEFLDLVDYIYNVLTKS
ncbi:MAG: ABC transporter ATP-binding protein [Candidatus Micrarchaeaceae archaeon]